MTLTIELPDEIAGQARSAGLLEPANVARLFQEKLAENGDPRSFFDLARTLRTVPVEPVKEQMRKVIGRGKKRGISCTSAEWIEELRGPVELP